MEDQAVLGQDEYTHNHVVRNKIRDYRIAEKAVSNQGVYTRKFSADLSQYYDIQNVEIIAIVTQGNGNNVLNVNSVAAGSTVNW